MDFLTYPIAFVTLLGVLVFIHELGHFAVARWCGVKVLRFSIGFGRPLFRHISAKTQTEWVVALIPLGGYVRMLDEREGHVPAGEKPFAFNYKPLWQRFAIVAAGPLANLLLAFLLYFFLFFVGSKELLPLLGAPQPQTAAAVAGIKNGDQVRRVNGTEVVTWQDFHWLVLDYATKTDHVVLEIETAEGNIKEANLSVLELQASAWEGDPFDRLGLNFYRPHLPPVVGSVLPNTPAAKAGLQAGDAIVFVDQEKIQDWARFVDYVRVRPQQELAIQFQRDGVVQQVKLIPDSAEDQGKAIGRIGVTVAMPHEQREIRTFVAYPLSQAMMKAAREVKEKSIFSLRMLGKMLTGAVSWKNLSGPVTIADYAGKSAKFGWDAYVRFMALVSISLGILNLLPVPVLDGGHLLYYTIEAFRGKPLPEKIQELGLRFGLAILLTMMCFALFNDINRLLSN